MMEGGEIDEIPPEVIYLKKGALKHEDKTTVFFNETFSFTSLNPNTNTDSRGALYYNDVLIIKKSELEKIYQNNKKEDQTYPQTLKLCKACNVYFYNSPSHRDEKHRTISSCRFDLFHHKKNLTSKVKLEVQQTQTNHTEYAYHRENKLYIYSEGKQTRKIQMKIKNCSDKIISIDKAVADNSRNGYILWSDGTQQANLQIYQFNEEIAPDTMSTQVIQIHLPGEIKASKDLSIKLKTTEGLFLDLDVIIYNNYLHDVRETKLEERLNSQWKYEKNKEDFKEDLNTKACYTTNKELFESLSVYIALENKFKVKNNKQTPSFLPNLPKEINRIVELLSEETTRDNFREKFTHHTKAELAHYLSEMSSTTTTVIASSFVGLKTKLTIDLDLQSLQQLNVKMNDTLLLKENEKVHEAKITLSEIHQTTVEVNAILELTRGTPLQVTPPIRVTPFSHVMTAIEATEDLGIGLATKNYFFPTSSRTKHFNVKAKIDDVTLDNCQTEAVNKINNLVPGDVFTLQGLISFSFNFS